MTYAYFPGCALAHSASAYSDSIQAVASRLGLGLAEIDDWNCCGATEYASVNLLPAYALVARNLALAGDGKTDVVAPCSLCYVNLSKTERALRDHPALRDKVNDALSAGGLSYTPGRLAVRHLLDVIANDVGTEAIAAQISRPLYGLRVAPYYGCLIVRPGNGFDDPEQPESLDRLLETLGAEVVEFPLKADCCGGHMTQISAEVAYALLRRLLQEAVDRGADLIVTVCPMCQLNLDAYQGQVNRHFGTDFQVPVLFFTQAMGLAFGLTAQELGIGKEIVPAAPVLRERWRDLPPPSPEEPRRPRRNLKDRSLPMPARREHG